ncbi:hypothetical protein [Nostoc sp.]|uniref:hypothetical protein n=1 Tax=Nostoc sp. TaxID=1180 RepID=UPI003FA605B7
MGMSIIGCCWRNISSHLKTLQMLKRTDVEEKLIGSMHFLSYLTDSGFDFSVLCEFRVRLISGSAEQKLLDILLKQFKEKGIIKDRGKQRTDSTQQEENSSNILEDQLFNLKSQDLRNFFTKLGLVSRTR